MSKRNVINVIIVIMLLLVVGVGSYFALTKLGPKQEVDIKENPTTNDTKIMGNNNSSPSGQLKIEDLKVGTGKEVKSGDTVVINYLGTLENGAKFDSSYDRGEPFTTQIGVGQVIEGWDQGVPGMKVGGKRKLTIPPELGYGPQGAGTIPPNSTLIFEVELIDIK